MKLLVRNLSRATTEHELRTLFAEHGKVTTCNLVLDIESKSAITALNQSTVDKSKIRVKLADA